MAMGGDMVFKAPVPVSPVRIRMTPSKFDTKIFPSRYCRLGGTNDGFHHLSAKPSGTTLDLRLGTNSMVYSCLGSFFMTFLESEPADPPRRSCRRRRARQASFTSSSLKGLMMPHLLQSLRLLYLTRPHGSGITLSRTRVLRADSNRAPLLFSAPPEPDDRLDDFKEYEVPTSKDRRCKTVLLGLRAEPGSRNKPFAPIDGEQP